MAAVANLLANSIMIFRRLIKILHTPALPHLKKNTDPLGSVHNYMVVFNFYKLLKSNSLFLQLHINYPIKRNFGLLDYLKCVIAIAHIICIVSITSDCKHDGVVRGYNPFYLLGIQKAL